jgi:uncharacterized protein YyaL (SSP411 family)
MRRFSVIIAAFLILSLGSSVSYAENGPDKAKGISFFEGTWAQALEKAKAENKPIFLDIYATWCGPCKMLKRNTFTDSVVGAYFNQHFINVELDGEKGDGLALARQLRISGYPSLFVLDTNGKPVIKSAGYIHPEEMIKFGQAGVNQIPKNNKNHAN